MTTQKCANGLRNITNSITKDKITIQLEEEMVKSYTTFLEATGLLQAKQELSHLNHCVLLLLVRISLKLQLTSLEDEVLHQVLRLPH